jgi:hypothetical protein
LMRVMMCESIRDILRVSAHARNSYPGAEGQNPDLMNIWKC